MKKTFYLSIILFCSCSMLRTGIKNIDTRAENSAQFIQNDMLLPIEENILFDYTRAINPDPIIIDDKLLYFTQHGKIHVFDLLKKREYDSKKFSYGSNVAPVYFKNYVLFSLGAGKNNLILYDLMSYKTIWKKTIPFGIESKAVFDETGIYLASANGYVFKCDIKNSKEMWKYKTSEPIHSNMLNLDSAILVSNDAGVSYKLNKKDGNLLWKSNIFNSAIYSKALEVEGKIMLANIHGDLFFIDSKNGALIRKKHYDAPFYANPSKDNTHIFIGNNNGNLYKLDSDGNDMWSFQTKEVIFAQVLIGLKNIYFGAGDGTFYILDKESKEKKYERKFKGRFRSVPIFWKDKLIVFSDNDDAYILSTKKTSQ